VFLHQSAYLSIKEVLEAVLVYDLSRMGLIKVSPEVKYIIGHFLQQDIT
jgi:hypothetical protein